MMLKDIFFRNVGTGVYLLDFSCFAIPKHLRKSREETLDLISKGWTFSEEAMSIMRRGFFGDEAGIGDATGVPASMIDNQPFDLGLNAAMAEMEMIMYTVTEDALRAAQVKPSEVDILITATDSYVPVPSMSAMIANRFKMRSDVRTYSLAGHTCTSGIIVVELAQQLLKAAKGKVALLVLHDNCTAGFSRSNLKPCCSSNVLFRLNGAALVLSNRSKDRQRAKYELMCTERVLLTSDAAYNSIKVREDGEGQTGIFLAKEDLLAAAGESIKATLTKIAPRILPLAELAKAAWYKGYRPDMGKAFDHILIHTGAAAVISTVVRGLRLDPLAAVPSSETLQRFGNTMLCSTYYVLANIESMNGVKKGDRILQLSFGAGFKCGAGFWRTLRDVKNAKHSAWDPYD